MQSLGLKYLFSLAVLSCMSVASYGAEWQCGELHPYNNDYGTRRIRLPITMKYSHPADLIAANEQVDDFINNFKGKVLCVKGSITEVGPSIIVYDVKSGDTN